MAPRLPNLLLTCDMGVNVGWQSSLVSCCMMPHRPNSSTQRSAGRTAAPLADKVSTAAFRNKGADMPERVRRDGCKMVTTENVVIDVQ